MPALTRDTHLAVWGFHRSSVPGRPAPLSQQDQRCGRINASTRQLDARWQCRRVRSNLAETKASTGAAKEDVPGLDRLASPPADCEALKPRLCVCL